MILHFFGALFFLVVCVGVHYDRIGKDTSYKWGWAFIATIVMGILFMWEYSADGIIDFLTASHTLTMFGYYILIGIAYSCFEFTYQIMSDRSAAKNIFAANKNVKTILEKHNKEVIYTDLLYETNSPYATANKKMHLVQYTIKNKGELPKPTIDKSTVIGYATGWIILWPAYLVEMLFGRLVVKIVNIVSSILSGIGGKIVQSLFKGIDD